MPQWGAREWGQSQAREGMIPFIDYSMIFDLSDGLWRDSSDLRAVRSVQVCQRPCVRQENHSGLVLEPLPTNWGVPKAENNRKTTSVSAEPHLDILVNNAGIMFYPKHELTEDKHEMTWQSNHLGKLFFFVVHILSSNEQVRSSSRNFFFHWSRSRKRDESSMCPPNCMNMWEIKEI